MSERRETKIVNATDIVKEARKKTVVDQNERIVLPGTELEERVRSIWEKLLVTIGVGLGDDFFRIGGDSLTAVRLTSAIRKEFGVRIDLNDIFSHREIYSQAEFIARADKESSQPIPLSEGMGRYPATNVQSRIWFLSQAPDASRAYVISGSFDVEGELNIDVFRQSLNLAAIRHESLRTRFVQDSTGEIFQDFIDANDFRVPFIFAQRQDGDINTMITTFRDKIRNTSFDLATGPLLRVGIIRIDENRHVIVYAMHHTIADGWSINVLARDVSIIYDDVLAGREPSLHALRIQYKDVARWRQYSLASPAFQSTEQFWLKKLSGRLPVLDLPVSKPRPVVKTFNGATITRTLSNATLDGFRKICHEGSATLFTGLLAVVYVLMHRLSGQYDIILGTPTAGRDFAELEDKVGPYFNLLAFRQAIDGNQSFRSFLQQVKVSALEVYQHQSYPFDKLVEQLDIVRDTSRSPVFDVMIALHNHIGVMADVGMEDLVVTPIDDVDDRTSQVDLAFAFIQHDNDLQLKLTYNPDVFEQHEATGICGYFESLLKNVLLDPLVSVSEVEYITDDERQQLLFGFSKGSAAPIRNVSIVALLRERAMLSGSMIAVRHANESLSYADLMERSEALALHLKSKRVNEGDIVGLMVERSVDMIVAIFGILMARCAYLPLDNRHPIRRILYVIDDSNITTVVADDSSSADAITGRVSIVKVRDSEQHTKRGQLPNVLSNDVAYVMYTSGSTGQPKGVMIEHRSVINFFEGINKVIKPGEHERLLAITNTTFDISVLELIWTLTQGIEVELHSNTLTNLDQLVNTDRECDFSLFFFASYDPKEKDKKYKLLFDSVKVADANGFEAVWIPERHFHEFGGIFPNPSLISSALAVVTRNIRIRSGSVVMPLHDPLRVAEEWSVVDNLSNGRVGISFASGWHPNDFVLGKSDFRDRHARMWDGISAVQQLWRGNKISRQNGVGSQVEIGIFPAPLQAELPVWITSAGNRETFVSAGARGANILTHFLGQDITALHDNIRAYRDALENNGFERNAGKVTLMVHTYIGEDAEQIERVTRIPFIEYLKTSAGLSKVLFEKAGINEETVGPEIRERVFENAYMRYRDENSLIGTFDKCRQMTQQLRAAGVDEIACLIDFGLEPTVVLKGVDRLTELLKLFKHQRRVAAKNATMLQTTPSFLKAVLADGASRFFLQELKTLLVGGDQFPEDLEAGLGDYSIYNMYGPTEATVWATAHRLTKGQKMSIGRPMRNISTYILDGALKPTPPGVPGTIYIGGACLARGYLNRPDLTAEKFILDPFQPGEKMYNTGDLGRWRPDGQIDFLGRADYQVKIRGVRIELGEIETAILQTGDASDVVVTDKFVGGEKTLVAYLVSNNDVDHSVIRSKLLEILPEYLVPSYFQRLDSIPLNDNGKVDRKKLPDPEERSQPKRALANNAVEQKLIDLWTNILGRTSVDVTDNFFELGGHSLRVIRLVSGIKQQFGIEIDFRIIFTHVTVEAQARYIQQAKDLAFEAIPKTPVAGRYLLGPSQQRFWILNQFSDNALSHIDSAAFKLDGPLDIESMKRSLSFLVERHEALRTIFIQDDDEVFQKVMPSAEHNFQPIFVDVSERSDSHDALVGLYAKEQQTPFDLENGPLLRAVVVKLASEEHALFCHMPHIVSDGWSIEVLIRDLTIAYNAFVKGEDPDLAPLRIQYKDYAAWTHQQNQVKELALSEQYWLDHLSGRLASLNLPTNKVRPAIQSHEGRRITKQLPAELVSELRSLCRQEGATLFMGLLSVLKILFFRYTREKDIIVGTPVANRDHKELEDQIGLYLNTLVLRTEIDGSDTLTQVLSKEKSVLLQAYSHKTVQFDNLVRMLNTERNLSRSALFDVFVVFQNFKASQRTDLSGITVRSFDDLEVRTSQFDLDFTFVEADEDVRLVLTYNPDVYDEESVNSMIAHFLQLMSTLPKDSNVAIDFVDYIGRETRTKLLNDFNDTHRDYPRDETIIGLFEKQVEKTPENVAVTCENVTVTYKDLDRRANILAAILRKAGARREKVVSILLDRSELMTISILAVWKSGAAYLLIDPELPADRINFMLEESGSKLMITRDNSSSHELLPGIVCIDPATEKYINESWVQSEKPGPTDLAFVIFTSGSTGRPKGILIEHRSKINHLVALINRLELTSESVIAQTAPPSFDIFLWQMITALLVGGRTVIYSRERQLEARSFIHALHNDSVSILQHVPSYLNSFIDILDSEKFEFKHLRYLVACGEEIKVSLVRKWFSVANGIPMVNAYGPAEASDDVSLYFMTTPPLTERTPIGKPIQNSTLYILDKHRELCPPGVPGEIAVGGECLARGYIRSELTKEKFVANPFERGGLLYLTGDLGKWLSGGDLVFTGRNDSQVKVRGHRIELGEVEATLLLHPDIREAAVLARDDEATGLKYLVAYYEGATDPGSANLQDHLSKRLPNYMVPAFLVYLEKLPITGNGKIDKKALLKLEITTHSILKTDDQPTNHVEEILLSVWKEVLSRKDLGIRDNFFEMGGDSIKAIQISGRLHQRGYKLELKRLFEYGNVLDCTPFVVEATKTISQAPATGEIALSPAQIDFLENNSVCLHHYNMSVALSATQVIDTRRVQEAWKAVVNHHDLLRCVFKDNQGWVQYCQPLVKGTPDVKIYDLTAMSGPEATVAESRYADALQASMSLHDGPLYTIAVFKRSQASTVLIIIHHLLVDIVSWRIILEDFEKAYREWSPGNDVVMPPKTDGFATWTATGSLEKQSSDSVPDVPSIFEKSNTSDNSFAKGTTAGFELLDIDLSAQLTTQLKSGREGIQDFLLAGLAKTIRSVYNRSKTIIDLESHGRSNNTTGLDVSRTVGWFTSIYPFLLEHDDKDLRLLEKISERRLQITVPHINTKSSQDRDILFNYLGDLEQSGQKIGIFSLLPDSLGSEISPALDRRYALIIDVFRKDGILQARINYNTDWFEYNAISKMAAEWKRSLTTILQSLSKAHVTEELSPAQMRMWMLNQFEVNKLSYNSNEFYELLGPIDSARLENAFLGTIFKHESLRTNFILVDGMPRQNVNRPEDISFKMSVIDLEKTEGLEREFSSIVAREASKAFDLTNGLLLRVVLIRLTGMRHVLLLSYHHIVADRWSLEIMMNDLVDLYINKGKITSNALSYQYVDFTRWINKTLNSDEAVRLRRFWLTKLDGDIPYLQIRTDRPRSTRKSDEGSIVDFSLDLDSLTGIQTLKRKHRTSTHSVMSTLYNLLLSSRSGQSDIIIGSAAGGRIIPETEDQVGLYLNTLPIRTIIDSESSFADYLRHTTDAMLECYEHQLYPLERIVDDLQIKRNGDSNPLFEVGITWLNTIDNSRTLPGITLKPLKKNEVFVKHELWLFGLETPRSCNLSFHYHRNLFDETTIRSFVKDLNWLLSQVIGDDRITVRDLIRGINRGSQRDDNEFIQRIDERF